MNNIIIEDQISDHFVGLLSRGEAPCIYRVNPDDFAAMVGRLNAKVERDHPLLDESVPVFVTLHIAGGTTRVYAAADDTPFGEFRESPSCMLTNVPFTVGDVVRLKSGGSNMTVENVVEGVAHVVWFQAQDTGGLGFAPSGNVMRRDRLPLATLSKRL